jgi:hypothetical protein
MAALPMNHRGRPRPHAIWIRIYHRFYTALLRVERPSRRSVYPGQPDPKIMAFAADPRL